MVTDGKLGPLVKTRVEWSKRGKHMQQQPGFKRFGSENFGSQQRPGIAPPRARKSVTVKPVRRPEVSGVILTAMKTSLAAALILLGAVLALAQHDNEYLYVIRDGQKLGFINRSGAVVVTPKYDGVGEVHEGRIAVHAGSLGGYIDLAGKVVIEPKYEGTSSFHDSRAVVRVGDKYSLIDPSGKSIADIPYRVLGEFHQGLLRVSTNKLVDAAGKKLPTKTGFVDLQGKVVIAPQFVSASEFPDDPADLAVGMDKSWCYFDRTGKVVIRMPAGPLEPADPFVNGRVRMKDGFTWGYKDATGAWAIPAKFNDAKDFKDGLAKVQLGSQWIVIDVHGNEVHQKIFPSGTYSEGLALASDNDLQGWIDAQGHLAFPMRKYQEAFKFSDGLARFKLDGQYGYLDRSGNMKIKNQYDAATDFDHGLARVASRGAGAAYINTEGATIWKAGKP